MDNLDLRTCKVGVEALMQKTKAKPASHVNNAPAMLSANKEGVKMSLPTMKVAHPFLEQIQKDIDEKAAHKVNSSNSK